MKEVRLNEDYEKDLQSEIKRYKKLKNKTDVSRWGYSVVDLLTRVTFLNHINFPKIKQMTSFGGNLMNSTANVFAELAAYNDWSYSNVLDLVKIRLDNYKEIIEQFDDNKISYTLNEHLRDSYPDYFIMAGMPMMVQMLDENGRLYADMQMLYDFSFFPGYFLEVNDGSTVLVMLKDSAKTIIQRKEGNTKEDLKSHPLNFNVEFITISLPGDNVSLIKDRHFKRSEYKTGTLTWNGETLTVKARTAIFDEDVLFEGSAVE